MSYASKQSCMEWVVKRGEPDLNSGCILWSGSTDANGYGKLSTLKTSFYAHRLAFEAAHGREPVGLVRHACDTPQCINPAHLLEGTHRQNTDDKVARGRQAKGHHPRQLTPTERDELRKLLASGVSKKAAGRMTGYARSTINRYAP